MTAGVPSRPSLTNAARFTGTLAELAVADLIQILHLAGKDAHIVITQGERDSQLWCAGGSIVHAESGPLLGEAAAYRMLACDTGFLVADLGPVVCERSIESSTQRILLEAARRKDEAALLRAQLGDELRCYRLDSRVAVNPAPSVEELLLLRSFDAARSVRDALESSVLGDLESLLAVARWIKAGVLVDAGMRAEPAPEAPPRRSHALLDAQSFLPLAGTLAPEQTARARRFAGGWQNALWGLLLLIPGGYWLGTRVAQPAPPTPVLAAPRPAEPLGYRVELRVQPESADIWLDGERVASGHLVAQLSRNGSAHELRVDAPGFVPARIQFVDVAPPAQLQLEPLPQPVLAAPSDPPAVSEPAAPPVRQRGRARPSRGASALRAPSGSNASASSGTPAGNGAPTNGAAATPASAAPAAPRVQIIDGDPPLLGSVN